MADTPGTPLAPLRDARLSPDDVAERSFSQVKRGYAENEVRAYLRLVADELASASKRARELAARVESLEARLAAPTPVPSDQDLITALGEETARVLGQARESAVELRTKAEEHARNLVREAQENARQLRTTSQQAAETKAREAEDGARTRANEIVAEARTMRDRVLADLGERRQELERQVSELRAGRGKLVETYQVVERALAQANRVLADEPGAGSPATTRTTPAASPSQASTAASPTPRAEPATDGGASEESSGDDGEEGEQPPTGDDTRPVVVTPTAAPATPGKPAPRDKPAPLASTAPATPSTPVASTAPGTPSAGPRATASRPAPMTRPPASAATPADAPAGDVGDGDAAAGETRDVGALFDRLRSGQPPEAAAEAEAEAAEAPEENAPEGPDVPTDGAEPTSPAVAVPTPDSLGAAAQGEAAGTAEPATDATTEALDAEQLARRTRDEALVPVSDDLARRAKRAVQDEQNDVLDGLRRQRGKIDKAKVLTAPDEQLARWAHVLQPAVDRAYEAGAASTGAPVRKRGASVPAALLTELTAVVVTPLRSRLEESLAMVDSRSPADLETTIAQALGARYREWRTQDLDDVLGDALAIAYSRGVYAAAPQGARLRWIPERQGKCPDCDDNALEPTPKGSAFPTGQTAPPAHPGCRCLLMVEPEA